MTSPGAALLVAGQVMTLDLMPLTVTHTCSPGTPNQHPPSSQRPDVGQFQVSVCQGWSGSRLDQHATW